MSSDPRNYIEYRGARKPSNDRPEQRVDVWLRVKVRGRGLGPRLIGCTPALPVTQKCRCSSGICGLWRYISAYAYAFAFNLELQSLTDLTTTSQSEQRLSCIITVFFLNDNKQTSEFIIINSISLDIHRKPVTQ